MGTISEMYRRVVYIDPGEWNLRRIKDHFEEVEIVENTAECMASIQDRPYESKFKTVSNKGV